MLKCPDCRTPLDRVKTESGIVWHCRKCDGTAVLLPVLRKTIERGYVNRLWQRARQNDLPRVRDCPGCDRRMEEVLVDSPDGERILDTCENCQFIWIDADEWGDLPRKPLPKTKKDLKDYDVSPQLREKIALKKMERDRKRRASQTDHSLTEWWQWIAALAGLPIEREQPTRSHFPFATWGTVFLLLLAAVYTYYRPETIAESGLIPAEWDRRGGVTLFSSFFLHAGILHLIGNLYFLIVFGDNVEHLLGPFRFICLLVAATLLGDLCHILLDPDSTRVCIGASGGISGIIAFYALSFPHARISLLVLPKIWLLFGGKLPFLHTSAKWLFCIWILLQIFYTYLQHEGHSNISGAGHLGGALAGLIVWWIFTRRSKRSGRFDRRREPVRS